MSAVAAGSFGCVQGVQAGDELLELGDKLDAVPEDQFRPKLALRPLSLKFSSSHRSYTVAASHVDAKLGITFHGMPPGSIQVKSTAKGLFGYERGVQEGDILLEVGKDLLASLDGMSADTFKSFLRDRPLRMKFQVAENAASVILQDPSFQVHDMTEVRKLSDVLRKAEYTIVADADVGKLGVTFHGMPPGRIEVKGVAEGMFGSAHSVQEGDVLIEVGTDKLQALEGMSAETFKSFLKDRPLKLRFLAAHAAGTMVDASPIADSRLAEQDGTADVPDDSDPSKINEAVYTVVAGSEVGKLGISFSGMPPGRVDVKVLTAGSFGSESDVQEGDILMEVGKEELLPLEGMSSEVFKNFLKGRPLKMKLQRARSTLHSRQAVPPTDAAATAEHSACAQDLHANITSTEETQSKVKDSRDYTIVADADVGKLGVTFHGMPPGRIEVKGVAEGMFGSAHSVQEGDVLIEVGTDKLQALEGMSAETFKSFLKDRPLKLRFLAAHAAGTMVDASPIADSRLAEQDSTADVPDDSDPSKINEAVYTVVAGSEVGKLGISFSGMPPGRVDVKVLTAGSFGSESDVQEGDILMEVGKEELLPLEGMSSEVFKNFLKGRPLKMKLQRARSTLHSRQAVPPTDAAATAEHSASAQDLHANITSTEEAQSKVKDSRDYTIVADADVGKLGVTFHGMPPGRIEVKGVAEGMFGSAHSVQEGDVLIEVGTDKLQALEGMSAETFKSFLKDRPLKLRFLTAHAAGTMVDASPIADSRLAEQDGTADVPDDSDPSKINEAVYTVVAGSEVGKLGISFSGMPPGRVDVKVLTAGSFGSEGDVQEGDILMEVGKEELLPLEGMSSEVFKNFLKGRPLKMKLQRARSTLHSRQAVPPTDAAATAEHSASAQDLHANITSTEQASFLI